MCLGHQAIGQHFGGQVVRGGLMHGKTSPVDHDGTGVFAGLPSPVHRDALPFADRRGHAARLTLNAINARRRDGSVMGFRHATLPIHGVQFHPESIATEHGHAMLRQFPRDCGHANRPRSAA